MWKWLMNNPPRANIKELTDANFQMVLANDQPVLVTFWAEWCMPCRMLTPTIEKVANKFAGRAQVGKMNTDNAQQTAVKYGINALPTVILFSKGQVVQKFVGVQQEAAYSGAIEAAIRAYGSGYGGGYSAWYTGPEAAPVSITVPAGAHASASQNAAEELDGVYIVDGSNVFFACAPDAVEGLVAVIVALNDAGADVTCMCDASLRHKAPAGAAAATSERLESLFRECPRLFVQTPAGKEADEYILRAADREDAVVVSSDQFRDWAEEFPWIEGEEGEPERLWKVCYVRSYIDVGPMTIKLDEKWEQLFAKAKAIEAKLGGR